MNMDQILNVNHLNARFSADKDLHGLQLANLADLGTVAAAGKLILADETGHVPLPAIGGTTSTYAQNTVTIGGAPVAGNTVSVTVSGVTKTYTVLLGDTTSNIATALAALINGDPLLNTTVSAAAVGDTVTITSLIAGSPGNGISLAVGASGGGATSTAGGTTLGGGSIVSGGTSQYATGSVTIGSSPAPTTGNVVTVTINGHVLTYTVTAGQTPAQIAQSVSNAIDADVTDFAIVGATYSGNVVIITAKVAGTPGNVITVTSSITGSSSAVASGATLGGGAITTSSASVAGGAMSTPFLLGTIATTADTTFTLPTWSGGQEILWLDRTQVMEPTTEYTRVGRTITLSPAIDPGVGNTLEIWASASIGDIAQNAGLIGYSDWVPVTAGSSVTKFILPTPAQVTDDIKVYEGLIPLPKVSGATTVWRRNSASEIEVLDHTPAVGSILVQYAVATVASTATPIAQELQFSAAGAIPGSIRLDGVRRIQRAGTLTDVVVIVEGNGGSGSTTVDIQMASAATGPYTTILAAPISVLGSAGNYAIGTGVLATTAVPANSWFLAVSGTVATGLSAVRIFVGFEQG